MRRERTPTPCWRCSRPIRKRHAFADVQLVLKVKQGDADGEEWLRPIRERLPEACCLAKTMSALETRSLINCCDCFVSLHRSEGFGRGTGEAMFLGRLAMATDWSGNLDYMTPDNSLLVDHRLVPVGPADYPFGEGQMWAEADVDHASALLDAAIADPARARGIAAKGRRDIRLGHGYRAVGLRILDRVNEIIASAAANLKPVPDSEIEPDWRIVFLPRPLEAYEQATRRELAAAATSGPDVPLSTSTRMICPSQAKTLSMLIECFSEGTRCPQSEAWSALPTTEPPMTSNFIG